MEGIITSSCGIRENPVLNKIELHDGLDIAVEEGTGAKAVRSGKVTSVRTSPTLGIVVEYETLDGFTITYAHLKEALVSVGDSIKQGDIIAKTGSTGLSTGPHLHYRVYKGQMLIDPMQFVQMKYTDEVRSEYAFRGADFYDAQ